MQDMNENKKVVIIGAGPGGLTAGKILADTNKNILDNNIDVLIFDKNPKDRIGDKTCAGGLPSHTMKRIPDDKIQNKVDTINIIVGDKKISFTCRKPCLGFCSRLDLGQWQLKEAEKAGCIVKNEEVTKINFDNKCITASKVYDYDYLIGADGSNSIVRRSLGFNDTKAIAIEWTVPNNGNLNDCEIYIDAGKLGITYGWVFPHGKYASVGTGGLPELLPVKSLEKGFIDLMNSRGINLNAKNVIRRAAPLYLSYHGFSHKNDTVFLVGDAASFICTPTGEGIYQAMKSGELAAKKILGITENFTQDLVKLMLFPSIFGWILPFEAKMSPIIRPALKIFGSVGTSIGEFFCDQLEKRDYLKNILTSRIYLIMDQMIGR
jgi:geranylgeranyl reductase